MQDFEKLILIRKKLGYDKWEDFAKKLGYTNKYSYRSIETGSSPLNDNLKLRLVESLNVNPKFIESGEGDILFPLPGIGDSMPGIDNGLPLEEIISRLVIQNDKLIDTINRNSSLIEILSKKMSG